ncbi:MAG: hypothetical protein J0I57_18675 [Hyphomicrobium sp.]|nr:hypothetical protein [Hyphomicrobium sp.]MBN9279636.1 hypothetical protein [Hyphomicrobium sp.]OJU22334.1 MAG: hypothetical protein BGN89_08895 [Alphaproteobacteria bacterium 64-6]
MRRIWTSLAALAVASGLALSMDAAVLGEAAAQQRMRDGERPRKAPAYVVAESRWGHGTISGPVRRGPNGWEVRMPGGTWIECKRSCSESLRLATVDFWETQGRNPPDGGPNYFTFDFWF